MRRRRGKTQASLGLLDARQFQYENNDADLAKLNINKNRIVTTQKIVANYAFTQ